MAYQTFPSHEEDKKTSTTNSKPPPPLLYNSPSVSSALITAFGRPTLIEYDIVPNADAPAADDDEEFTPIRNQHRSRSNSLYLERNSTRNSDGGGRLRQRSRSLSKSSYDDKHISAYTYRITRQKSFSSRNNVAVDQHHLIMCQNPDGTYSHVNYNGEPLEQSAADAEGNITDMTTTLEIDSSSINANEESHQSNQVPAEAIHTLRESISNYDNLPPHVHPVVPPEIIHPAYTSTSPPLKLWPLAVLVFYNVSGGPFGIEPSIRAAGNFYAILGFIVFPFVWAIPEALVTAELGSAFRDPSAGVAWVEEAFGEGMGGMCGYLGWISGATDNAIYPTLFLEYVTSVIGNKQEMSFFHRFALISLLTVVLSLLNYRGLEIVGKASLLVCVVAMSPFVLMTIIGAPQVVVERWFQMPEEPEDGSSLFDDAFQTSPGPLPLLGIAGIMWRPYLNNLFWNLNSFDGAASFAGETTCVKTTYPKGIFVGLFLCIICYIVPLMVAVGATDYSQSEWVDGHLGQVAVDIGGEWLGAWTIFAAGISNLAMYEAELSSDSFKLMGMAERGHLPKLFKKRSKYGTPTNGIILGTVVIIVFGCADFGQLLALLNANYAFALLLEYAAFVKLRLYHKDLQRPYRIPIPDWASVILVIPPCLGIVIVFLISNWYVWIFTIGAIVISLGLHKFGTVSRDRGWFAYENEKDGTANSYNVCSSSDHTESLLTAANQPNGEFENRSQNLDIILEENKIT